MNQIDLILENIRLGHINQLMLEATTPAEVQRGVALINESMQTVYGVLHEAVHADTPRIDKRQSAMIPGMVTIQTPVASKTLGRTVMIDKQVPGMVPNEVMQTRNDMAKNLRNFRKSGIQGDNMARLASQTGTHWGAIDRDDMVQRSSAAPFAGDLKARRDNFLTSVPRSIPITREGIAAQTQEAKDLGYL